MVSEWCGLYFDTVKMTGTITHFLTFFALAYLAGLFWPVFHAIIGAPESVPDESAGMGAQLVKTMRISKPTMIFRCYGAWLCRKQNEFEKKHDKSLLHFAYALCHYPEKLLFSIETSYGRDANSIPDLRIERFENKVNFFVKLLPGESAMLSYKDNDVPITGYFMPEFPGFDYSKMPLSPYKALGLCPTCSIFWIMLLTLISGCVLGAFPPLWFLLTPAAYGFAMRGSKAAE